MMRELGHEPGPGSLYLLFEGCELRQIRGGSETRRLPLPRIFKCNEGGEIITSYLTPIPPPPPRKQKQLPRRPRSSPPARRGPAAKFVPLFVACKALAEARQTADSLDDLAAILDAIADGLAIAKRVAGEN